MTDENTAQEKSIEAPLILIIEDDNALAKLIQINLRRSGFRADAVGTGEEAVERVSTSPPDLLLLDYRLPDMSGQEVISALNERRCGVPFMVGTGRGDEATAVEMMKMGARDYLVKDQSYLERLPRAITLILEQLETERKLRRAEEEQRLLIDQLKESRLQLIHSAKMSAVGTLVAGVAHELNNPIMSIINFVQYCLKHTGEDDRRYAVLSDAEQEAKQCAHIVRNLLTFSHNRTNGDEDYMKAGLQAPLERVLTLLSYRTEKEQATINSHIAQDVPEITMKPKMIQQAILNLVNNAMDAVIDSPEKEIEVDIRRKGDIVRITVKDSGTGISPDDLPRIFEPFFTTKSPGKGTGLGLSITQSIIDEHGGKIFCDSHPCAGTTFEINLPIDGNKVMGRIND
ncbi:MAG: ATP-binding protein [Dehalococcoidia bacterium]